MKIFTSCAAVALAGLLLTNYSVFSQTGNYFAGYNAGASNTGSYNAFVGYLSGPVNTSGNYNTFLGTFSGFYSTIGSSNTFIGGSAGFVNTTGSNNTFTGEGAGLSNTTASSNSFYGRNSGRATTTGTRNSFFGTTSGNRNVTGSDNAFFGFTAGFYNTASNNTFIGSQSGEKNTSGTLNTFIGRSSGLVNTTGVNNTFVGGSAGAGNTTGARNSFLGISAGLSNTTGYDNTFIGREAGRHNTTGTGNTCIGNYAQLSSTALTNSIVIGNKAIVTASNSMVLGSINGQNGATVTMKVGIGTSAPGYNLHVNGTAAKPGGGSWTVASDKRLKKNIKPFQEGLEKILQVNPVWFSYNGKAGLPTDKEYVGVIAQDMQKIAPHTVGEFTYETEEGQVERYLDYDANALAYTLVNAVKELNAIALQQVEEIKKLREKIAMLEGRANDRINEGSAARLWQNSPNPYASSTVIKYYIPEDVSDAQIQVISMAGQEVYSRQLTDRGESQIEISNQMLSSGGYVYQLIVNGNVVDKKKMIMSK